MPSDFGMYLNRRTMSFSGGDVQRCCVRHQLGPFCLFDHGPNAVPRSSNVVPAQK
uniref:Uncharacterized protein n=1 Tax=Mycolicibacterium sp. CBMA 213 TaxID=1968788 RepID=A0A343VRE0_9MYCO|nr:hypothetical protein B5P44_p00169 [Mycolicibacterium sp. CBMA 213]